MSNSDLGSVRAYVFGCFLARIRSLAPSDADAFEEEGIENYHKLSHRIDHSKAWPRSARVLSLQGVDYIVNSPILARLKEEFGTVEITNEAYGGAPEIIWRLVRPNETEDVQSLHTDGWFWDINNLPIRQGSRAIKIWTMLHGDQGQAGLRVVDDSHLKRDWEYSVAQSHDFRKPVFNESSLNALPRLLPTRPGESVVFSYDLLHGGAVTHGNTCRVSIEFTVAVPL